MSALSEAPLWISGILLVGGMTLLSMVGLILVRRRVALERLRTNNEVAGFKFATVGVLYAVLLAFAVLVVWEKFNRAEEHVAQEAGAAATIYRLAAGLGDQEGASLRDTMTAYLKAAITEDWPAMARGRQSPSAQRRLRGRAPIPASGSKGRGSTHGGAAPAGPDHRGPSRQDRGGLGDSPGGRLAGAAWRCPGNHWLHLFLRDRELAGANANDRGAVPADLFRDC
jgi:Protein of unknown function (DUF4239)